MFETKSSRAFRSVSKHTKSRSLVLKLPKVAITLNNQKVFFMTVKFFILGLPGSGKSTVARYISMCAGERQRSTTHISDYDILYEMFREDIKGQFKPADFGGFDVLDLTVFDTALKKLEQEVNRLISSAKSDEVVLIEFARNDYYRAFHQFSDQFLQDAYFLYLDAQIDACKRRIRERVANPSTQDDFFVSDYIFTAYYNEDNGQYIPQILERDYKIDRQRVAVIDNNCLLQVTTAQINQFVDIICGSESRRS